MVLWVPRIEVPPWQARSVVHQESGHTQESTLCWQTGEEDGSSTEKLSESEAAYGSGGAVSAGSAATAGDRSQLRRSSSSTGVGGHGAERSGKGEYSSLR